MAYGSEASCSKCGSGNEYCTIYVELPLPAETYCHYFCTSCSVAVAIPVAVENRFLLALDEKQTDQFGNASWFRSELAALVKQYVVSDRPYSLTRIPQLQIFCPDHKTQLELWTDYPSARLLLCQSCGSRTVLAGDATWISGSTISHYETTATR